MRLRSGLLFALLLGGVPSLQADVLYDVTDLGMLEEGGCCVYASGINNAGQVTGGFYRPSDSQNRAFLYSNGQMTDLGTLGGVDSYAYGINDRGQVVGASYTSTTARHAFLYSNGQMTDLGTLTGDTESLGYGINDRGQVTGVSGVFHAFLYSDGQMMNIDPPLFNAIGYGINNRGEVTGQGLPLLGNSHAFLYSNGQVTDLGTLGGEFSYGQAINDLGQVTGSADTNIYGSGPPGVSPFSHAFLYSDGQMIDLGTLGGGFSYGWGLITRGK